MLVASEQRTVVLRGGLSATVEALRLLWDLEARGFSIGVDDDLLVVRPRSRLTAEDVAAIRTHREELIRLVQYCEREVQ